MLRKRDEEDDNIGKGIIKPKINVDRGFDRDDPPLTLDDILNLWDGIEENTGRILIISSNYYEALDKALVRPGRIDINLKMKKVNLGIFREMFVHLYNGFDGYEESMKCFPEYVYTPAEIMNYYTIYKDDPVGFLRVLCCKEEKGVECFECFE